MMPSSPMLEVAEDLKALLLEHIQSGNGDGSTYTSLRRKLLAERLLKEFLPEFLWTDTSLQEVRQRAQRLDDGRDRPYSSYETRRAWLAAQFQPLLEELQRPPAFER